MERPLDHRQAARCQHRRADALDGASRDQLVRGLRQSTQQRSQGKPPHAEQEDPSSPEPIAERPSDEDERRQRKEIGVGHPLELGQRGVEILADGT